MRSLRSPHLLVVVAGYALGALALYSGLPQEIPPSWSVPGRGTLWRGAPMVAFLLPTAVAVTDALLRGLSVRHPVDETSAVNVLAIYDAIMCGSWSLSSVCTQRCSPDYWACSGGIRTRRTLSDRALWIRVHRSAGYIVVACGAVIVFSAIAVPRPLGPGMVLLAGPAAVLGTWLLVRSSGRHARA